MLSKLDNQAETTQFNMTGVIDIIFLLIIFFMLVCQFIVAENFEVTVPDRIASAQSSESAYDQTTTVTVMSAESRQVVYAVGSERVVCANESDVSDSIAAEIDKQLQNLPAEKRVVNLRIDRDIHFSQSRHALAGISQSTATDIRLAVTKKKQSQ